MWNTALSEALYGPIQGLEITLRNKIHVQLTAKFRASWYDDPRIGLQYAQQNQIASAKQSLQLQGKPLDPQRVSRAELRVLGRALWAKVRNKSLASSSSITVCQCAQSLLAERCPQGT
jgi:hypothetical protein